MIIITESEIEEYTKNIFYNCRDEIIGKHNPTHGEKDFVLCMIEQCLGLLEREKIDDQRLIIFTNSMISLANEPIKEYDVFLDMIYNDPIVKEQAHKGKLLSYIDRKILDEMMQSNLAEYLMKGEYQNCCYTAMKTFLIALYCLLVKEIDVNIKSIDLIADLDDELQTIQAFEGEAKSNFILVRWHSTNKINSMYTLYKSQYVGLEPESILDLVSADVIEEDYYFKDKRFTIAPSMLMKQYLAIIEREINLIIRLSGLGDPDGKHLEWYDMKNRVRKRGINIEYLPFKLYKALDDLYKYRNGTMHGKIDITCDDYEVLLKYKRDGLFNGLSIKKLELSGKTIHPTVDEIGVYMGK